MQSARDSGGLGRGQGFTGEQGHSGAGRAAYQRLCSLGGDAAAHGGWRILCFEGLRSWRTSICTARTRKEAEHESHVKANANPAVDLVAFEKDKIKGAVRTDFILSAEIIAITLGMAGAPFVQQVTVLVGIALAMTVRCLRPGGGHRQLDDLGLWLNQKPGAATRAVGAGVVRAAPDDEDAVGGRHGGHVSGGRRHFWCMGFQRCTFNLI